MASNTNSTSDDHARLSSGRGGAGNIHGASTTPGIDPAALETPTLKEQVYTTGRGGSGNMAQNNDPDAARRAQDVSAPVSEGNYSTHVGRGGAANVVKPTATDGNSADKNSAPHQQKQKGLVEKGKEWLFGKK